MECITILVLKYVNMREKNDKILSYFVNEKNVGKKTIKNKLFR